MRGERRLRIGDPLLPEAFAILVDLRPRRGNAERVPDGLAHGGGVDATRYRPRGCTATMSAIVMPVTAMMASLNVPSAAIGSV